MKSIVKLLSIFLIISFFSCDDFNDTDRFFTTDKKVYHVGDSIFLSVHIATKRKKKKIRIYDNLQNIRISVAFSVDYKLKNGESTVVSSPEGIKIIGKLVKDEEKIIKEIVIGSENPYVEIIGGKISEDKENFIIDFKDYGLTFFVNKETYNDALSLNFHGELIPINPAFGESFENFVEIHSIKIE